MKVFNETPPKEQKQKEECKILQFPIKKTEVKMPSMGCCITEFIDWRQRGELE
jgi:hypothetical protein